MAELEVETGAVFETTFWKNPIEIGSEFSGLPLGLASVLVVVVVDPSWPPPFSSFLHW